MYNNADYKKNNYEKIFYFMLVFYLDIVFSNGYNL
jgi:hypothetical protein